MLDAKKSYKMFLLWNFPNCCTNGLITRNSYPVCQENRLRWYNSFLAIQNKGNHYILVECRGIVFIDGKDDKARKRLVLLNKKVSYD
jgi:hypothetical protein